MGCLCSKSENESELANDDVIVTIHDEPYNVKPTGNILDMLPDMPPIAQNVLWALLVALVMICSIFILPALFRSGNPDQANLNHQFVEDSQYSDIDESNKGPQFTKSDGTGLIGSDYGPPIKPELVPKMSDHIEYINSKLEDHLSAKKDKANENDESETTNLSNKPGEFQSDSTQPRTDPESTKSGDSGGSNGSQGTTQKQTVVKQSGSFSVSHKTSGIKSDDAQSDSESITSYDSGGSNDSQSTTKKQTVVKQSDSTSGSHKTSEIKSGDTESDSESIKSGGSYDSQGTTQKQVAKQSGNDANSNLIGTAAKVQNDDDLPSSHNSLSIEGTTGSGPNMSDSGANLGVLNPNKLKSNDDQLIQSSDKSVTLSTTGGQHANDVNGDEFEYYSDNSSEVVTSQSQPPLNTKPHGNVLARSTEPSTMSTGSHKPNDDNIPRSVSLPNIEPGDRYSLPTNLPSNELHSVPKTLAKQTSSSNIEFTNDTMSDCEIPKAQSSHLNPVYASTLTGLGSISMQNTNKFTGSDGHGQSGMLTRSVNSGSNDANTDVSDSSVDQTSDQSARIILSTPISPMVTTSQKFPAFTNSPHQSDGLSPAHTTKDDIHLTEAATNQLVKPDIGHLAEEDTKQDTEEDTKQATKLPISNALSPTAYSTDFTNAPPQSDGLSPAQTAER
eukprot:720627_1